MTKRDKQYGFKNIKIQKYINIYYSECSKKKKQSYKLRLSGKMTNFYKGGKTFCKRIEFLSFAKFVSSLCFSSNNKSGREHKPIPANLHSFFNSPLYPRKSPLYLGKSHLYPSKSQFYPCKSPLSPIKSTPISNSIQE